MEDLNSKRSLEIFLSSEDFKNVERIEDIKEFKNNLLFNVFVYVVNFDKISETHSKLLIKKLCTYIDYLEKINDSKINHCRFLIFNNEIHITYELSNIIEIYQENKIPIRKSS
ncbi:MAG: hypothetical protein QXF12_04330 [Candidatus Aenigmatarchaeota archaeon]